MSNAGNTAPAVAAGAQFDVPGVPNSTQFFDQYEDTVDLGFTPSVSNSKQILNIANMRRTDVVFSWQYNFSFTDVAYTEGGGVATASDYFPYNLIGSVELQMANQYAPISVESGIDWYIFNQVRPVRKTAASQATINYSNPLGDGVGAPHTGYLYSGTPQANLVAPAQLTAVPTAATTINLVLDLPGSVFFDEYYSLDPTGNLLGAAPDAIVSPQYMAGVARLVAPTIKTNSLLGSTLDEAPVVVVGGTGVTAAATGSLSIRRRGCYNNSNAATLPPLYPWQYQQQTTRLSINGTSKVSVQVPDNAGQVTFMYLRLYDPSANSGIGGAIDASALSRITVLYGSGLTWFDGTPLELQALWLQTHNFLLPNGVYPIELGIDELGTFSNKRALNTLTTGGISWVLQFNSPTSSTAYAVLGIESLTYVV